MRVTPRALRTQKCQPPKRGLALGGLSRFRPLVRRSETGETGTAGLWAHRLVVVSVAAGLVVGSRVLEIGELALFVLVHARRLDPAALPCDAAERASLRVRGLS